MTALKLFHHDILVKGQESLERKSDCYDKLNQFGVSLVEHMRHLYTDRFVADLLLSLSSVLI